MKKTILLCASILLLTGCAPLDSQNELSQSIEVPRLLESAPEKIIAEPEVATDIEKTTGPMSPMEAILQEDLLVLNIPGEMYPKSTQIRMETIDYCQVKATISQDGLPDDVLRKQEYELLIEQQESGEWKVTSKKLIKEECWPDRTCE